ncbi:unnamed protein product [Chrysodeixis includens]|uniref:Kazal-like domain-containing protein n=1 Tax=Chrysodeixis includens TaxID=689277 RepID=A0A9N8PYZ6_CHRIL|nr:unnamed protein product [Chrysodeixis includens]
MCPSTSTGTVPQTIITIAILVLTFSLRGISSFCPLSYQMIGPVCGNDGTTYPSMCELEAARLIDDSIDVALLQPCNDYCNEKWDPICGTDMVTYANLCMFEHGVKRNKDLKILHVGQCLTPLYDDTRLDSTEGDRNPLASVEVGQIIKTKKPKCDGQGMSIHGQDAAVPGMGALNTVAMAARPVACTGAGTVTTRLFDQIPEKVLVLLYNLR